MPLKDEFDLASPLTSHYMENFRAGSELSCCDRDVTRQKYVPTRCLTYRDHPHETTYRYDVGQYNPHRPAPPTVCLNTATMCHAGLALVCTGATQASAVFAAERWLSVCLSVCVCALFLSARYLKNGFMDHHQIWWVGAGGEPLEKVQFWC